MNERFDSANWKSRNKENIQKKKRKSCLYEKESIGETV